MSRWRWPGIARGIVWRLLIYGAMLPLALYMAFPELPAAWSLWRAGAFTEAPQVQPATVPPAPQPQVSIPGPEPSQSAAVRDAERRYLAMMLVGELDQCRRADLLLRRLCDSANYASRTRPAFIEPVCEKLPDLAAAIARADSAYRELFPAQDVNAALELSRESFEQQFAGPLRQEFEFTGIELENLDRIVHGHSCEIATDPKTPRRLLPVETS